MEASASAAATTARRSAQEAVDAVKNPPVRVAILLLRLPCVRIGRLRRQFRPSQRSRRYLAAHAVCRQDGRTRRVRPTFTPADEGKRMSRSVYCRGFCLADSGRSEPRRVGQAARSATPGRHSWWDCGCACPTLRPATARFGFDCGVGLRRGACRPHPRPLSQREREAKAAAALTPGPSPKGRGEAKPRRLLRRPP